MAGPSPSGRFTVEVSSAPGAEPQHPTPAQTFIAIESEVLLHHAAEMLMRLIHAHSGGDPCPLLRLSELRRFKDFNTWVSALIASDTSLEAGLRDVFGNPPDESSFPSLCQWVALIARHFLDAAPYNAAKHGMTLAGGAEQRTTELDDRTIPVAEGASVSRLQLWRPPNSRTAMWTTASRLISVEAARVIINASTELMRYVWAKGRRDHLPSDLADD